MSDNELLDDRCIITYFVFFGGNTRILTCFDNGYEGSEQLGLQGVQKTWYIFARLTLSNICQLSKHFHCQSQEKILNNTITKDPSAPLLHALFELFSYFIR